MSTSDFTDRKFQEKRTEHENILAAHYDFKKAHGNPDDEKFDHILDWVSLDVTQCAKTPTFAEN